MPGSPMIYVENGCGGHGLVMGFEILELAFRVCFDIRILLKREVG